MTPIIRSAVRNILTCLTFLFCFNSYAFYIHAQDAEVLSKRPPVMRIFDPDKNESTVSSLLFDPQSGLSAMFDPNRRPPDVSLNRVEYTYPGNTATRPQAVTFVFLPLDKYKIAPDFSVAVDGVLVHQGTAILSESCCVEINGRKQKPQRIGVVVPLEVFERMTQARKIELKLTSKVGKYSFKLNDYQRKNVMALASTIK